MLLRFRVQSSSPSQSSPDSSPHLCRPEERSALLDFKSTTTNLAESYFRCRDIIQTWNESLVMPSSLLNLTSSLEYLSLCSCNLQGNFPNQVFQLPSLQFLDLSYNFGLGGNLPESNQSGTLEYLNLDSCQFYGSIPASIFNLTHLTFLSLSSNNILGCVPSWLFSLPSLFHLDLQNNCLTGSIDHVEMPNLFLQEVYLSSNEISGSIPSFFFDLAHLTRVDLSSNNLTGTITPNMLSKACRP
ncbi:hypothetical protein SLE2022_337580 [Rubroshorea leprosula]